MESVLIAALLAASPLAGQSENAAPALDRQCFGLMASLAGDEDPRVSALGRVAAQYFLGRIDAAEPGFDPDERRRGARTERARTRLLRSCGDAMQAGGRDFRSIGQALAAPRHDRAA